MPRPTLLLLHAFGASGRSWGAFRAAWNGRSEAPDLPGFAQTPPLSGALTIDAYADRAAQRLETIDGPVALVGWSMGGKIAAALAARRPERLVALALVAPSPPGPEPMEEAGRGEQLRSRNERAGAEKAIDDNATAPLPTAEREAAIADWLTVDKKAWRWWWLEGSREALDVSTIAVPTRVLAGGADPHLGADAQREHTLPHLPGAELRTLPGVGHLVPREAPAALAAALADWPPLAG